MRKDIVFENAQQLHEKYPATLYAPQIQELQKLRPGNLVKVCAFDERFWTEIIAINKDRVTARIDNDRFTPSIGLVV